MYQPRSAMQEHIWCSCISPARSINRDQSETCMAQRYLPRSKRKHVWRSGVDQGGESTAISKAKAYPAQLYITSTVYQLTVISKRKVYPAQLYINNNQHSKPLSGIAPQTHVTYPACLYINNGQQSRNHVWTTQPRRSEQHINRVQQSVCQQLLASRSCKIIQSNIGTPHTVSPCFVLG